MFPLTHIATAQAVLGKENNMTVLGSVFPDFVTYLGIGRNVGHELGQDLYNYCQSNYPECVDFALAVLTHGTSLPGIDSYADEVYHHKRPGFCFQEGAKIAPLVEKYCKVPANMALWKAHNFIEIAFDVLTAAKYPDLQARAERHIYSPNEPVIEMLHHYLQVPKASLEKMFQVTPRQFCFDGTNVALITEKFLDSLERRHGIVGGDLEKATEISRQAVEIITPQYEDFMTEVLSKISDDLSKLPTAQTAILLEG